MLRRRGYSGGRKAVGVPGFTTPQIPSTLLQWERVFVRIGEALPGTASKESESTRPRPSAMFDAASSSIRPSPRGACHVSPRTRSLITRAAEKMRKPGFFTGRMWGNSSGFSPVGTEKSVFDDEKAPAMLWSCI